MPRMVEWACLLQTNARAMLSFVCRVINVVIMFGEVTWYVIVMLLMSDSALRCGLENCQIMKG